MNFLREESLISLDELRKILIRLEDTIIFSLIERCQFGRNHQIYDVNSISIESKSFLDFLLFEMEAVHAKARRYTSPDELPFSDNLPKPVLPDLNYKSPLQPNSININRQLKKIYIEQIVPVICKDVQDDLNYGSSATRDIECLQALSKRIHYGKFIAEAKFQDPKNHQLYVKLIKEKNRDEIYKLLTNTSVEERLLKRLRKKATIYGQDITDNNSQEISVESTFKIPIDSVVDLYEKFVIPLTKEVEVEYLLGLNVCNE